MIRTLLIILGIIIGLIIANAILYATIVILNDHRWKKVKSDKFDMLNKEKE